MKLLRMDCDSYPMTEYERQRFLRAGIDEIEEILGYDPEKVIASDPDAIAVIPGYLKADTLAKLTKCKAILRMGTGYDKIDVAAATEHNMAVTFVPGYCVYEVAEHALALLLSISRKIPEMMQVVRDGSWMEKRGAEVYFRLRGKTVGIVGFGRIGREFARMCHALGMKVLAYDEYKCGDVGFPFEWRELDDLITESDIVSLHCPLTPETKEMFGEREFKMMKNTAIFLNVARGALCDEAALGRALNNGDIAYAGVDVHEHMNVFLPPESFPYEGIYAGVKNIILTPHCASLSKEAWEDCVDISASQLEDILAGKASKHCVNGEELKKKNVLV